MRSMTALAAFLACASIVRAQEETDEWRPFLSARTGLWFTGEFAAQTGGGREEIVRDALAEIGIDIGLRYGIFEASVSAGFAGSEDVFSFLAGAHAGVALNLSEELSWLPSELRLTAGVLWGTYDVRKSGIGDFDPAVGFQLHAEPLWKVGEKISMGGWVDFRAISFEYEEDVLRGDDDTVGPSIAFGLSFQYRF